jgi:hypothetical protein
MWCADTRWGLQDSGPLTKLGREAANFTIDIIRRKEGGFNKAVNVRSYPIVSMQDGICRGYTVTSVVLICFLPLTECEPSILRTGLAPVFFVRLTVSMYGGTKRQSVNDENLALFSAGDRKRRAA